ncbi:hypothetical protein ACLB2K_037455 [Fragaria x ananassa]
MQYAQANADGSGMFYCPCKMCKCRSDMHRFPFDTVWDHLKSNGFWERYTCWIYHGETSSRPHDHGQFYQTGSTSNDPTTAFINDMFPHDSGVCLERQHIPQAPLQAVPRGVNTAGIAKYNRLIAFQQTPLCPGHEKTVLQCVMEVMHIKVDTKSTVTAVDRYLQYAASLLPDGHRHPTTHHKVRRILRDLGLSYIKIHACRYDCVLFWGKDADGNDLEGLHRCPVCGTDRYKRTPAGNRKPVKVGPGGRKLNPFSFLSLFFPEFSPPPPPPSSPLAGNPLPSSVIVRPAQTTDPVSFEPRHPLVLTRLKSKPAMSPIERNPSEMPTVISPELPPPVTIARDFWFILQPSSR